MEQVKYFFECGIYILMIFVTMWVLHTFKKQLDIDIYDSPHNEDYDDWDSNAHAYAVWSLGWPLVYIVLILVILWKSLLFVSKKLDKK